MDNNELSTNLSEVGTDCISRQAAIDRLTEYGNGRAVFISVGEAIIRIEQLPPANCSEFPNSSDTISRQAEQSACEYCHEDLEGYVKPIEKNGHAFVRFGMDGWELSLSAKGWHGETKINYCPMCGRKLQRI